MSLVIVSRYSEKAGIEHRGLPTIDEVRRKAELCGSKLTALTASQLLELDLSLCRNNQDVIPNEPDILTQD